MGRHREYEFSKCVKKETKLRADEKCEICSESINLQVHHIVGVWYALNFDTGLSGVVLSGLENAQCLCSDCHFLMHIFKDQEREIMNDYVNYLHSLGF